MCDAGYNLSPEEEAIFERAQSLQKEAKQVVRLLQASRVGLKCEKLREQVPGRMFRPSPTPLNATTASHSKLCAYVPAA